MDRNAIIESTLAQPNDAIRRALTVAVREADPAMHVSVVPGQIDDCRGFALKQAGMKLRARRMRRRR